MNASRAERLPVRAVVFCCDGLFQRFLIERTSQQMHLVGVVFQSAPAQPRNWFHRLRLFLHPWQLAQHVLGRWTIRVEQAQARDLLEPIKNIVRAQLLDCPVLVVEDINAPETTEFLDRIHPEVVLVNGTRLIRSPLLDRSSSLRLGMINVHTGFSPYSRGGNCNLHMLRENHPELVGVTVHHIDAGIDSGDLIFTARPQLEESDTFERIESKVFLLGIELLMKAVRLLLEGRAPRVPQWTKGQLFLQRTGYAYRPWQRFQVRRKIHDGMIRHYLADQATRDQGIRTVGGGLSY